MTDSIFDSVKLGVNVNCDDTSFDQEILEDINTAINTLYQVSEGKIKLIEVVDETASWKDLYDNDLQLQMIKTYVKSRVRIMFDPPNNSSLLESINRTISEMEWRIQLATGGGSIE